MTNPPNVFSTSSTTLAAWFEYAHSLELRLIRYDPSVKLFYFFDPDGLANKIVHRFHELDPEAHINKFIRIRNRLAAMKMKADGQWRNAQREARRG